ncbi:MAG: hypothetical protein K5912_00630 [Alphaproteobacteria bacterium]|nr:hypothetical protein [Alphaproteobacteria bacterium]
MSDKEAKIENNKGTKKSEINTLSPLEVYIMKFVYQPRPHVSKIHEKKLLKETIVPDIIEAEFLVKLYKDMTKNKKAIMKAIMLDNSKAYKL